MPTFSGYKRNAFRAGMLEAQDILVECADVDLIHLSPRKGFLSIEKWLTKLIYHDVSKKLWSLNPGLQTVRLDREYELFVLVCPYWRDILYANAIQGWKDHCRTSVLWIDELWERDISCLDSWLPAFANFDHVIIGISGSGKALEKTIGQPIQEMPGGVDAIRFSPHPNGPVRVIDILSIGRRRDEIHRVILDVAEKKDLFYVNETLHGGDAHWRDYREHRKMYADMLKRSRFFMVAPGKVDVFEETGGQEDLGYRYFEGAAAGAILLGQSLNCMAYQENFDWPEAVIELAPDGSDTEAVISDLLADPERLIEIGRRNAKEALLRHDWIYRWKTVFKIAGLEPTFGMKAREGKLAEFAKMAGVDNR